MAEGARAGVRKAALFIDFDNVFSGLRSLDESAAIAFATNPESWLTWLETYSVEGLNDDVQQRSLLIRRVYLNPASYGRYRAYFVRAGFQVIDCPTLTAQGKNSADIQMVMDIIDTLEHPTQFDEMVLFSSDSDFTPLLLRLRAYNRRTLVLATGFSAAAYRAACDNLLNVETFIEKALGTEGEEVRPAVEPKRTRRRATRPAAAKPAKEEGLEAAAKTAIRELIQNAQQPLVSASVATAVRRRLNGRLEVDWAGAGSFRAFVDRLGELPGVKVDWSRKPGYFYDPERHEPPAPPQQPSLTKLEPVNSAIAREVCEITGAPFLSTDEFHAVFEATAEQVNANRYSLTNTSRAVRDKCQERGVHVSRQGIVYVLKSLAYSQSLRGSNLSADQLARAYATNLIALARRDRVEFSEEDEKTITQWIVG